MDVPPQSKNLGFGYVNDPAPGEPLFLLLRSLQAVYYCDAEADRWHKV